MKYGVAANATLDITVNPDFEQIEADEEEINLSRFPLLLRELFHNSTVGALVEGVWDRGMTLQQIAGLDSRVEWDERDINLLASYEIAPKSRVYLAYNLGDTAAERAEKLRFKVAYLLSY